MSVFDNIIRVASNPVLARDYSRYLTGLILQGEAVRSTSNGVELGGFTRFSEYHTCVHAIRPRESSFLNEYPFGMGAVLDVGANLGLISLILAERYPDRDVHAFEPNPSTVQSLLENVTRNEAHNVRVCQKAVGNEQGTVGFRCDDDRATARIANAQDSSVCSVTCTTLDQYVEEVDVDQISLLKVDVEGYEADVLRGCSKLLREQRIEVVYFEVCPALTREAGFRAGEAARLLERAGYQLHRIGNGGSLEEVTTEQILDVDLDNWVALRS